MAKEKITVILDNDGFVTCVMLGHNNISNLTESELEIEYDMKGESTINVVQR